MLIGGQLKDLPPPRDVAAAKLCVPVVQGCPNAPAQIGAVVLKKPFEKMKPYDFKDLGAVLGTAVVPKWGQVGPAKYFRLDITRHLKRVAAGQDKFHGLAVMIIPNRSIDDGWTVRVDITKEKPTYVELDVYTAKK